jgi:hypothetical protein
MGNREWGNGEMRNGNGNWGVNLAFNHFFPTIHPLGVSQILYVPCKRHGDVYVAIKKGTLEM